MNLRREVQSIANWARGESKDALGPECRALLGEVTRKLDVALEAPPPSPSADHEESGMEEVEAAMTLLSDRAFDRGYGHPDVNLLSVSAARLALRSAISRALARARDEGRREVRDAIEAEAERIRAEAQRIPLGRAIHGGGLHGGAAFDLEMEKASAIRGALAAAGKEG